MNIKIHIKHNMSVKVKCIDMTIVKAELKNCPTVIREYVKALEDSNTRWKTINAEALKKLKDCSKKW